MGMKFIKNNKVVIVIVVILLVLIFFRSTGLNHFKNDIKKWAEPSVSQSNTISPEQAASLTGNLLAINLDKNAGNIRGFTGSVQNISADSVLSKDHIKMLRKHEGPVLLYSSEPGLSARIWMILSQLGCRNIYILTENPGNEVLKYKFQPDTLLRRLE
jgi:hypothetical protein